MIDNRVRSQYFALLSDWETSLARPPHTREIVPGVSHGYVAALAMREYRMEARILSNLMGFQPYAVLK